MLSGETVCHDSSSQIANLYDADPRTLFPQPASIFNRGSFKSAEPEQRESIFPLTSSSGSVCQGALIRTKMSRVQGLPRLDRLLRGRQAGGRQRLGRVRVDRGALSSSSASSSFNGAGPPPVPVKPDHLEGRRVAVNIEGPR
ncbi:hypothetical protein quinque_008739 [Culex quinquefasciatus]|uniref:Uncharacterized protein n=1 Tax=Culex pipiens pipiens TaxID=38569 RepID=A0ABD1DVI8_CULPP